MLRPLFASLLCLKPVIAPALTIVVTCDQQDMALHAPITLPVTPGGEATVTMYQHKMTDQLIDKAPMDSIHRPATIRATVLVTDVFFPSMDAHALACRLEVGGILRLKSRISGTFQERPLISKLVESA